ncbi:MAG: hypothetical protein QNJ72_21805 [Pleurocapsa sp. MO_226.B13]|nr:hypothetical protein [Pleurocapsa sp. MO_226.B13]
MGSLHLDWAALGAVMPEEKPSQSFSITGGQLSDVQIGGIAGQDMPVFNILSCV